MVQILMRWIVSLLFVLSGSFLWAQDQMPADVLEGPAKEEWTDRGRELWERSVEVADGFKETQKRANVISKDMMALTLANLDGGLKLLTEVLDSPRINEYERSQIVMNIARHLKEYWFMFMRHHGQDAIEYDGKLSAKDIVLRAFAEIPRDLSLVLQPIKWNRVDGKIEDLSLTLNERVRRERLVRQMTERYAQFYETHLTGLREYGQFDIENFNWKVLVEGGLQPTQNGVGVEFREGRIKEMMTRGAKIRKELLTPKKAATGLYFLLGAFTFVSPPFDFFSIVGEATYTSTFYSSLIWLGGFTVSGLLKSLGYSDKTFRTIEKMKELLDNPTKTKEELARGKGLVQVLRENYRTPADRVVDLFRSFNTRFDSPAMNCRRAVRRAL